MIIILVIQCKEIFKINDDNVCDKPKPIISIKNEKLLYSNYYKGAYLGLGKVPLTKRRFSKINGRVRHLLCL